MSWFGGSLDSTESLVARPNETPVLLDREFHVCCENRSLVGGVSPCVGVCGSREFLM